MYPQEPSLKPKDIQFQKVNLMETDKTFSSHRGCPEKEEEIKIPIRKHEQCNHNQQTPPKKAEAKKIPIHKRE